MNTKELEPHLDLLTRLAREVESHERLYELNALVRSLIQQSQIVDLNATG